MGSHADKSIFSNSALRYWDKYSGASLCIDLRYLRYDYDILRYFGRVLRINI